MMNMKLIAHLVVGNFFLTLPVCKDVCSCSPCYHFTMYQDISSCSP